MTTQDEKLCVELARYRLPGEGPKRTVILLRTPNATYAIRGYGQTKAEADSMATAVTKRLVTLLYGQVA